MIVIAGTVQVHPDMRDEALRAAIAMARATRAEPGCRAYRFTTDLEDPAIICIFEEWETEAALAAHFQTPHMAAFRAALPGFLAGAPVLTRYEVRSTSPM